MKLFKSSISENYDEISNIVSDFNSNYTLEIIKTLLQSMQNLRALSNKGMQIYKTDVWSLEELNPERLKVDLLNIIPKKSHTISLLAVIKPVYVAVVLYRIEDEIHIRSNNLTEYSMPYVLEQSIPSLLMNDNLVTSWINDKAPILTSQDSNWGTHLLKTIYKMSIDPNSALEKASMSLRYTQLMRILYALSPLLSEFLDAAEDNSYLINLFHEAHYYMLDEEIEHFELLLEDSCRLLKKAGCDNRLLDICEASLAKLTSVSLEIRQKDLLTCFDDQKLQVSEHLASKDLYDQSLDLSIGSSMATEQLKSTYIVDQGSNISVPRRLNSQSALDKLSDRQFSLRDLRRCVSENDLTRVQQLDLVADQELDGTSYGFIDHIISKERLSNEVPIRTWQGQEMMLNTTELFTGFLPSLTMSSTAFLNNDEPEDSSMLHTVKLGETVELIDQNIHQDSQGLEIKLQGAMKAFKSFFHLDH